MVLQRDADVRIWGRAKPGEKIRVTLGPSANDTTAGADRSTGRMGDAKAELEKAIALDPNDTNARKALAALQNPQGADSQFQ